MNKPMQLDPFASDSSDRGRSSVLAAGAHRGGGRQALADQRVQRHRGHGVVHLEPHAHQARLELLPAPVRARHRPASASLDFCRQLTADEPFKQVHERPARIMAAKPVGRLSMRGVGQPEAAHAQRRPSAHRLCRPWSSRRSTISSSALLLGAQTSTCALGPLSAPTRTGTVPGCRPNRSSPAPGPSSHGCASSLPASPDQHSHRPALTHGSRMAASACASSLAARARGRSHRPALAMARAWLPQPCGRGMWRRAGLGSSKSMHPLTELLWRALLHTLRA